jgi:cytochrome P450
LIGNSLQFLGRGDMPVEYLQQVAQAHGDLVRLQAGGRTIYVVSAPELVHEVLTRRPTEFHKLEVLSDAPRTLDRFLGGGLLTSDYEEWKPQRKIIQPLMHTTHIQGYAGAMAASGERLLAQWEDGEVRNLHADMTQVTMWIIAATMFGTDITNTPEIEHAARLAQDIALADITLPLPGPLGFQRDRQAQEVNAVLSALVARMMAERRADPQAQTRNDLLTLLMRTTDEDGNPMPDQFVRNNILTLFFAGHETTANTLTWALHFLDANPPVREQLHAEVDRVLGGRAPALADLPNLPYTEMVIKETMRCEPTVAVVPRAVVAPLELSGYQLAPNSVVFLSIYNLHHDARWWEDPDRFDPQRFAPAREAHIPKYAYLPFGGGPRICIGNHFALMEAQILLALIACRFRLEHVGETRVTPLRRITTEPRGGLTMRVVRRQTV